MSILILLNPFGKFNLFISGKSGMLCETAKAKSDVAYSDLTTIVQYKNYQKKKTILTKYDHECAIRPIRIEQRTNG